MRYATALALALLASACLPPATARLSPLAGPARTGDVAALQRLIAAGASPNVTDPGGHHWTPLLVRPRLLAEAGRAAEAEAAVAAANRFSYDVDAWQALEVAWRELPPPRADAVLLARNDYGAARGFYLPDRGQRWSRGRAWLRLRPSTPSAAYDVELAMGSPEPSPFAAPVVEVRVGDGPARRVTLARAIGAFTFRAPAPPDGVLRVELRAPR